MNRLFELMTEYLFDPFEVDLSNLLESDEM